MKNSRMAIAFVCLGLLAGCEAGVDFSDLQAYMDEVRTRPKGAIEPLPQFQPYESFTYMAANMRSPFQPPVKVDMTSRPKGSQDVKPNEARVRHYLEDFNIEIFEMVGTIANDGGVFALVSGAGGVHRVQVGDYLGRNHGRIQTIDESNVEVIEIVPDGEGGWLERPRSILLKERS
jgi:type IV pilus assembly protein PilP